MSVTCQGTYLLWRCLIYCFISTETIASIPVAIAVPTTAIVSAVITAVISSLITYCCCVKTKTKAHYTVSHTNTAAAEYETPVQTSASPLELKDNMAYGQVNNRQANTTNPLTVYETVHN